MKTTTPTFEDLKVGVNEATEQVKDFAVKVGNKVSSGYEAAGRGMKQIKDSLDGSIDDARHEIRKNPLAVVAGAALGGFLIGTLTGWLISRRSS